MKTKAIEKFLRPPQRGGAYTDKRLAMLKAHCEDGRLGYHSCCCLVGIPTADHPLGAVESDMHYIEALLLPGAIEAEKEFFLLGSDEDRRRVLLPLIEAEIAQRDLERENCFEDFEVTAQMETKI